MSEIEHHPFGPSRLYVLALCSGSHLMAKLVGPPPETSRDSADRGHRCHEGTAAAIRGGGSFDPDKAGLDGDEAEQVRAAFLHYERTREALALRGTITRERIEERVILRDASGEEILFGTLDVAIYARIHAEIIDWKFGHAVPSPAGLAAQLAAYAGAVLSEDPTLESVAVGAYHVWTRREYRRRYTREDLPRIVAAIREVIRWAERTEELTLRPSPHACRYCPAAHACPAAQTRALETSDKAGVDLAPRLQRMDSGELRYWRARFDHAADVVEKARSAVNAEIKLRIRAGAPVPGFVLKPRKGARKVDDVGAALGRWQSLGRGLSGFLGACKLSLSKLEDAWLAEERRENPKVTKKAAGERFEGAMGDLLSRGEGFDVLEESDDGNDGGSGAGIGRSGAGAGGEPGAGGDRLPGGDREAVPAGHGEGA